LVEERSREVPMQKRAGFAANAAHDRKWIDSQRSALETIREELRRELELDATLLGITGTSHPRERGDLSEEEREDEEVAASLEVLQKQLDSVNEALLLLDSRAYGRCLDCSEPIPRRRLEVCPCALRCTPCQVALEEKDVQEVLPLTRSWR
jgi:RNA polymerase-binding transcription factor